jgi:hypothetical protein
MKMGLYEVGCGGADCTELAEDRDRYLYVLCVCLCCMAGVHIFSRNMLVIVKF